jgi:hypothetical protein
VHALRVNKIPVAHGGGALRVIRYQWRGSGSAGACATGNINRCATGSCFPSSARVLFVSPPGLAHQRGRRAAPAIRGNKEESHRLEALDGNGGCPQAGAEVDKDDDEGGRWSAHPTPSPFAGASGCLASSATAGAGAIYRSVRCAQHARRNAN